MSLSSNNDAEVDLSYGKGKYAHLNVNQGGIDIVVIVSADVLDSLLEQGAEVAAAMEEYHRIATQSKWRDEYGDAERLWRQ